MLFVYAKSIEYNSPTSARHPKRVKMYAELTGDSKK